MQIEHIKEFIMLATNMSFSETAQKLYITQSTLSRHISSIEKEIDSRLLVRDTHHVRLTDSGKAFLDDSAITIRAYDNSLAHIDRLKCETKQILRIGYLYDAALKYLPRIKKCLESTTDNIAPQYRNLEYGDLMNQLLEGRIDVAVSMDVDSKAFSNLDCIYLGEDKYFAAVPKNHDFAQRESITLEEIAQEPVIFPAQGAMGSMNTFFSTAIKAQELHIEPVAFYEDIPSLVFQIESGVGVSLIFGHHQRRYCDNISFVQIANLTKKSSIAIMIPEKVHTIIPGSWTLALKGLGRGDG